jgi:predicted secreted protein
MRAFICLALASTVLASLLAGCAEEPTVYREPGDVITVKVKQEFIVATETNPPSGYMWTAIVDESMLELISSTVETSEAVKRGEAEVGLEQHFRCRALKKGTTEVQLNLRGPDVKFIWDQKTFPVEIR